MMRGLCCIFVVLILLPIGQCALSSPSAAGSRETDHPLLLSEILPRYDWEHIGILNRGEEELDLEGWSLSDGEGSWTFLQETVLEPGQQAFIGSNLTFLSLVHPGVGIIDPSADMIKTGRLVLADQGDEVFLRDNASRLVDVVAFGKSSYSGEGWRGQKCVTPPEDKVLHRLLDGDSVDTNTSADWGTLTLGRSNLAPVESDALVETILCPEEMRSRIIREIKYAQDSLAAAVYIISDPDLAGALSAAARRGVAVRVLVEGNPVGGVTEAQSGVLGALALSGCETRELLECNGFKRYAYLHCKYLVVDSRRVLISSENWARESMDSNRGWGVSVDSPEIAHAFLKVFEQDFDDRYPDVKKIRALDQDDIPILIEPELDVHAPVPPPSRAHVETVLAPENSYEAILSLIQGARHRLLLELFYLSDEWPLGQDVFRAIEDAARRGVSVRLLLDGNWYNSDGDQGNDDMASRLNQIAAREGLDLKAKTLSPYHPFATLHNKGVVADDTVLVCSINWVRASFEENRETGVMVRSSEIAAFFAGAFEGDWVDDAILPTISVVTTITALEGEEVVLNATCSDNSGSTSIFWDVGADGRYEGKGPFFVTVLPVGEHVIRVMVMDPSNNTGTGEVKVIVIPRAGNLDPALPAASALAVTIAVWWLRKRVKRT